VTNGCGWLMIVGKKGSLADVGQFYAFALLAVAEGVGQALRLPVFLPRPELEDPLGHAGLLVVQPLRVGHVVLPQLHLLLGHAVQLSLVGLPVLDAHPHDVLLYRLQLVVLHL
jgi:hypothetical protein